jgi:hypothetical protein
VYPEGIGQLTHRGHVRLGFVALCPSDGGLSKPGVIRDGQRGYEPLETLMLKDLPVVLETLVVLEEERKQREGEKAERMAEERKARRRVRDRERRQRKKLGEW